MLLLTLLPLVGWAQGLNTGDVLKVGGYDVTISNKLVVLGGESATIPTLRSITKGEGAGQKTYSYELGAIYGTDGKAVDALTKVGSYFQQVTVTVTEDPLETQSLYVPFMVVKTGSDYFTTENIWWWKPFNASVGDITKEPNDQTNEHGILYYYYKYQWTWQGSPTDDYDSSTEKPAWTAIGKQTDWRALMFPQINYAVKGLDRVGDDPANWEKYAVYASYKVRTNPDATPAEYKWKETYTQYDGGKPALLPRGGYWMISIPELYAGKYPLASTQDDVNDLQIGKGYVLKYDADGNTVLQNGDLVTDDNANIQDALEADFNWDYVKLYLAPQEAPFTLTATLASPTTIYNRENTASPTLANVTYVGKNGEQDVTANASVKWYYEGTAVTTFGKAGKYIGVVTYNDAVAIAEYTVTSVPDAVILKPAYTTKVYGQNDPLPKYVVASESGIVPGDNFDAEILPFIFLARSDEDAVATRENVGDHKYYIAFTDDYRAGKCNYEIVIQDNHSLLTITQAPLTITVSPASKKYKGAEPTAFTYTVTNENQLKFDDEATGTPGVNDIITEITRAQGEQVNPAGYEFTAVSKNYNVVASNKFVITPTDEVDGLQFAFKDGPSYVYKGTAYTPEFTLTDPAFDPVYTLKDGVDYEVSAVVYENNVDAGTADVKVTLKGSYSGVATGHFTITQKELTIKAKSYSYDPGAGNYEFTYDGFVEYEVTGETEPYKENETNQALRNTEDVKYFVAPTAPVVTKGQMKEQDVYELVVSTSGALAKNYKFKTQNGMLALNGTEPIRVSAVAFTKEYDGEGVDPEDLEIKVENGENEDITRLVAADLVLSSGPVYDIAVKQTGKNGTANATIPNVGKYDITLQGATVTKDYTIVYEGLENGCTITPRKITLIAEDKTKVFGAAVPTLTARVAEGVEGADGKIHGGLIGNDTPQSIGLINNGPNNTGYNVTLSSPYQLTQQYPWSAGYWSTTGEHATVVKYSTEGLITEDTRYPISIAWRQNSSNGIFGNYQVNETKQGKLEVLKAKVTIAAKDDTKQFGADDPIFTITVTPQTWTVGEGADAVQYTTPMSVATVDNMAGFWAITRTDKNAANNAGETVGEHQTLALSLTEAGTKAQDFEITASDRKGILTITAAKLHVAAKGQWIYYGGSINPYDVIITLPCKKSDNTPDGTRTIQWTKRSVVDGQPAELTPAQQADNDLIESIGRLAIAAGKDQVGTNYDAFEFNLSNTSNYALDEEYNEGGYVEGFKNNTLLVYPLEEIPLDSVMLAEICDKPLWQVLEDHKGNVVTFIMPRRTMVPDDWYAWVLPFDITPRDLSRAWGYAGFTRLDTEKSTGKTVIFKQTTTMLSANEPFLAKVDQRIEKTAPKLTDAQKAELKANTALTKKGFVWPDNPTENDYINAWKIVNDVQYRFMDEIKFCNKLIPAEDADGNEIFYAINDEPVNPSIGEAGNVNFVGLYTEKTGVDATQLYLARASGRPIYEFWPGGANSASVVLRNTNAYLQFTTAEAAAGARIFIEDEDGNITAINGVEGESTVNSEGLYNVAGQRVNKARKGIYIQNGKKVLVK